jgi:type I restriction enzyme S subunit
MSFPSHLAYKESGVAWLGEIPAHWKVTPIKRLAALQSGDAITSDLIQEEGQYPVYGGNGIRGFTGKFTHAGDYAIVGRQGALCGNVNYAAGRFWASEHAVVVSPRKPLITRWLGEVLRAMNLNQYSVSAAQPGLSVDAVSKLAIPVPPIEEQRDIATFLDRETAKIDALVEEQKRLIELLKEKRQALISQAVTKGLDPNVPMKDSGVEWLGTVPAHWSVLPLKYVVNFKSGGTPDKSRLDYWDGDVPWASAKDLKVDFLHDTADHVTEKALADGAATLVNAGSVLVVVRGMILARTFPVVTARVNMAINQDLKAVKSIAPNRDDWLAWLLRASLVETLSRLDEAGHGTKALRMDAWGTMRIAVPPFEEQGRIALFLQTECEWIDSLVSEAERGVALLTERRSSLISAAVTGKIRIDMASVPCGVSSKF